MPHYDYLIHLLQTARSQVNIGRREIDLSVGQAAILRASDLLTAVAGPWKIPLLPANVLKRNCLPEWLAEGTPPVHPPAEVPKVEQEISTEGNIVPGRGTIVPRTSYSAEPGLLYSPERLSAWIRVTASKDERSLLRSLGRQGTPQPKRAPQQRMHRLGAKRFNLAPKGLKDLGIVSRDCRQLELREGVREVLNRLGLGVNRRTRERAVANHRARPERVRSVRKVGIQVNVHGQQVPVERRRRPLPPRGTSDWGRSMHARRGGYARQRQCRRLGINPTAKGHGGANGEKAQTIAASVLHTPGDILDSHGEASCGPASCSRRRVPSE